MLVKAIATGFFGNKRIKEGQVFKIHDLKIKTTDKQGKETSKLVAAQDQFSSAWMEVVDAKEAKVAAKQAVKFDQEDNIEAVI